MKWEYAKLSEVAKIVTGGTPPKSCEDYYGGDVPWVRPPELGSSVPITKTAITLTQSGAEKIRLIPKDSVMVCCIGSVGKVGIAGKEVATNQQINALIFGNRVMPKFGFYHCLKQANYFKESAPKAVVPIINKTNFGNHTIPLPPLPEQHRIVEILDQADALRQQRRQADALSQRILPALFQEMFGDPLSRNSKWPQKALGEMGTLDRGVSKNRPRNSPDLLGGPYPLIQTGDIANSSGTIKSYSSTYSEKGLAQSKLWPAKTLCITIAANIGKTAILDFEACFPDSVVGFIPNVETDVEYVQSLFHFIARNGHA